MKFPLTYLVIAVFLAVAVFAGSIGIQLAVLGVALGIFFGTLSLRSPEATDATKYQAGN